MREEEKGRGQEKDTKGMQVIKIVEVQEKI